MQMLTPCCSSSVCCQSVFNGSTKELLMQELDPLATLPRLESLSLLDNEVTKIKHYRSATAQPDVKGLVFRLLQRCAHKSPQGQ